MTKIKLCGMSRLEDIDAVNELKPDYIGFIFWNKSFRNISLEKAIELKNALDKDIKSVGVFVDEDLDTVLNIYNAGVMDLIQLHGSEDNDYINKLKQIVSKDTIIIKAFKADSKESIEKANSSTADYVIFDPGKGEGMTFGWDILKYATRPYFLAGGLNALNVKDAIIKLNPYAVDVSSGIETDKLKDKDKMKNFVNAVREFELQ